MAGRKVAERVTFPCSCLLHKVQKALNSLSSEKSVTSKVIVGGFPFFNLPPEIRRAILELVVDRTIFSGQDALNLLLTCERMFREFGPVCCPDRHIHITPNMAGWYLVGKRNRVTSRYFARKLTISVRITRCRLPFDESYKAILNDMAENGKLEHLHIETGINTGYDNHSVRLVTEEGKDTDLDGPRYVTQPTFQSLLKLLLELKIPKVTLSVWAIKQHMFWGSFPPANLSGCECKAMLRGKPRFLEVDWKDAANVLQGVQVAPSDQ